MRSAARLLPVLVVAVLSMGAKDCKVNPVNVTVKATLANSSDVAHTVPLTLVFPPEGRGPRVVGTDNAGLTYLKDVSLEVSPVGISTETYYLQVFGKPSSYVTGEASDNTVVRVGDFSFIDTHTGSLIAFAHDVPNMSSRPRVATVLDPRRASVSAWLARVQMDDKAVKWRVALTDPACRKISPTACFDMSNIASLLTSALDGAVRAKFDAPASGGADPDLRVRTAGGVRLVSYIPNIVPALDHPGRRVRGVGLVFRADLQARAEGSVVHGVDLGTPYHDVSVWMPIAMLFESDGQNGLQMTFDPFDLVGSTSGQMASHIAVEVHNPGPGPIASTVGNVIANLALNGMAGVLSSPPPSAVSLASGVLSGFFTGVRSGPVNPDFDVALVPTAGARTDGSPLDPGLVPSSAGLPGVDLVFLE